ncbi:hypothetical protein IMG5_083720 [Ichthyophthirius multifiliis]|uniref:Vacuole membrane protein 1 n=1 Tax=Ichthyophthirius multifiliis TaxID=5932 RepID=G0QQT6_ICHMU|nr:hypothetical protein IMG5_083720 [Ichthyophthirius multifiliis]EGR32420.1 hypothetical protein IMG5_083720 [Ichthyophthirius multifiliis]|eukprot:XP_004036406.1 hypothetical protein IMG5_083720 [Ichthyophthirius multifiliis]
MVPFTLLTLFIITPYLVEGVHTPYLRQFENVGYFCAYWIILGVASSIGLGTGLHTFVLYLGPWIAKVTMVAYDCKSIPKMIPSKWNFQKFDDCPEKVEQPVTFLDILLSVQLEAFLWGLGTAIGELPPYFVAKAARASQKKNQELEEVEAHKDDKDIVSILKRAIYNNLQKYGFITVLLCASIPNPLFDLAGIFIHNRILNLNRYNMWTFWYSFSNFFYCYCNWKINNKSSYSNDFCDICFF